MDNRALPGIKAGRVRVNWKPVSEPSLKIKEGDIISWAGNGRIQAASLRGPFAKEVFY